MTESTKRPKRAKWFTDLPKDEQKAIKKREKAYREEMWKKIFPTQEKKDEK